MRLFGGERVYNMLETMNLDEDTPFQIGMMANTIKGAQEKVEYKHFSARKSVLEYDDVMNKQRELIYNERNKVLDGENIKDSVLKMIDELVEKQCALFLSDDAVHDNWDLEGLKDYFLNWILDKGDLEFTPATLGETSKEEIAQFIKGKAHEIYEKREATFGAPLMREIERVMLLRSVDTNWMDHIDAMDDLKQGIGLRAYGQHNPVVEYRNESYDMFSAMTEAIREQTAKWVLTVHVNQNESVKREKVAEETGTGDKPQTVKGKGVVSKNALCPCGSGKKYKRCCGKDID